MSDPAAIAPTPADETDPAFPGRGAPGRVLELSRTVRACLPLGRRFDPDEPRSNTFAAWPAPLGLAVHVELDVRCRGTADPETGYLVGIGEIDQAVRAHVLPWLQERLDAQARTASPIEPAGVLAAALERLRGPLGAGLHAVRWHLTPTCTIEIGADRMDAYLLSQQFDFAAAHRLRCRDRSDDENRALFGKCMNDHGHNYRLEVEVEVPMPAGDERSRLQVADLDRIVDETVVEPFDHRNLNDDVPDFSDRLPSVEHIARTCHERLEPVFAAAGARLRRVTVWETAKTACTYPAA